jgi:hypothetical protein
MSRVLLLVLGVLAGGFLYFTPEGRAGCGYGGYGYGGYGYGYVSSYPSYYPSYTSYASYGPTYSYHAAGCWRGNYYPAGYYTWLNNAWYHRELGYHCYTPCYHEPVFLRYAAVLPLVDLPTYSAQYGAGGLISTRVTYQTQQAQQVQAQQVQAQQVQAVQGQSASQVTAQVTPQVTAQVTPRAVQGGGDLAELKAMMRQVLDGQGSCAVRMDKLERRVALLEGGKDSREPPPEPKEVPTVADLTLVINRCAKCHQEGAKDLTDKGPVLLTKDGKAAALDDAGAVALEKVLSGEVVMPPKRSGLPALTGEEKNSVRRLYGL